MLFLMGQHIHTYSFMHAGAPPTHTATVRSGADPMDEVPPAVNEPPINVELAVINNNVEVAT